MRSIFNTVYYTKNTVSEFSDLLFTAVTSFVWFSGSGNALLKTLAKNRTEDDVLRGLLIHCELRNDSDRVMPNQQDNVMLSEEMMR